MLDDAPRAVKAVSLTTYRFEPRIPRGRHTGMDCRYPDHREVAQTAILGDWIPASEPE